MLIEYAGELVRRSVADARERRCYDKLVGAGTYVFGLNEELCVDATQAGEITVAVCCTFDCCLAKILETSAYILRITCAIALCSCGGQLLAEVCTRTWPAPAWWPCLSSAVLGSPRQHAHIFDSSCCFTSGDSLLCPVLR